jgi:hypothetical protein
MDTISLLGIAPGPHRPGFLGRMFKKTTLLAALLSLAACGGTPNDNLSGFPPGAGPRGPSGGAVVGIPSSAQLPTSIKENDWPQAIRIDEWTSRQDGMVRLGTFTVTNNHARTIDRIMLSCDALATHKMIAGALVGRHIVFLRGAIAAGATRTYKDANIGYEKAETPMTCDRVISATEAGS